MYKNKNKNKTPIEHSSPLYQTYTPTVVQKQKPGPPHRRQVVNPRPQTPQGDSVVKPEILLLDILSLVGAPLLTWLNLDYEMDK